MFITQFLNAFNDNVFKTCLVLLITYKIVQSNEAHEQMMTTLAYGLFTIPFFLFSATAGQLADKYNKAKMIRIIKLAEIGMMMLGAFAFFRYNVPLAMFTLFLMGIHSAFFGPLKYAILPDHLTRDELIGGNAFIEAGTFLAILIGTMLAGFVVFTDRGLLYSSLTIIAIAICGWFSSLFIPSTDSGNPHLKIQKNFMVETWRIVQYARLDREIFLAIMGISWCWLVGGTFISQFPNFTKDSLGAEGQMVSVFMSCFSVGVAIGSLTCNKLLRGEVNARYIPASIFIMGLFIADLHFASQSFVNMPHTELMTIREFLSYFNAWRIFVDIICMSIAAGIYIVPLYAILQTRSHEDHRARIIAANNIINALFMVISALIIMGLLALHLTVTKVFLVIAILNAFFTIYMLRILPHKVIRSTAKWLFAHCCRMNVQGLDHFKQAGERVVIIANGNSILNVFYIAAQIPEKLTFVLNPKTANAWWLKPFLNLIDVFAFDPHKPASLRSLIKLAQKRNKLVIFPQGDMTCAGLIAQQANATLLPIEIKSESKSILGWLPKISLSFMSSTELDIPANIKGRARRALINQQLVRYNNFETN